MQHRLKQLAPLTVVAALVLAGCQPGSSGPASTTPAAATTMTISDAWARPALEGHPTAAYMTIHNPAAEEDTLLSIGVAVAASAEAHETVHEGDLVRMVPRRSLPVPARGDLKLEPGGTHIMLMGLKEPLDPGDSVAMTLDFEKAGIIVVNAEVREAGGG